jgi:hypothetical protein
LLVFYKDIYQNARSNHQEGLDNYLHAITMHLVLRTHRPFLKFLLLFAVLVTTASSLVTLLSSSYTGLDHSTSRIDFHNTAQFYSRNGLYVGSHASRTQSLGR